MIRKCPSCRSLNVRRSSTHVSDVTWRHIFLSPYRCRDCRMRFWVFSRNAYYFAGMVVVVIVVAFVSGAIAWSVSGTLDERRPESESVAPVSGALAETVKLAENNDPRAQYKLAQMYAQGDDVPKDEKTARTWVQRAAEHGNADAQHELGLALRDGRGVVQDFERAAKWLRQAATSGHASAQYELGRMYLAGTGLPVDSVKAYMWLNLATAGGIDRAVPSRNAALRALSPDQVVEAQAEAHRLTEAWSKPATAAK